MVLGVNLVILFDKRIRYAKKVKNHWRACRDGATMFGSKSGFHTRIKEKLPQAKGVHDMIHRYSLACKVLPTSW